MDVDVSFKTVLGPLRVLDKVSLKVEQGEIVGLVGESGSGKSLTGLTIMRLLPPQAVTDAGIIRFRGVDLLGLSEREMRRIRGSGVAMIFQGIRTGLNPLMRIGDQVARVYRVQQGLSSKDAYEKGIESLQQVAIPRAEAWARAYPHQLSGGMCQRVLIAMVLACKPDLLIADEPTTGLDVTIQAQILELIKEIRLKIGASIVLITHDLGIVAETCERVVVIYAGQVMETGTVSSLFAEPLHPYTQSLLGSVLRVDRAVALTDGPGTITEEVSFRTGGCRFAARCPVALPQCWHERPLWRELEPGHGVACHRQV
ncbi:MAG TPA: ABC transporter ATP-binding protein [Anaerolineae bacterium]|nr:ABC transporter ATP-binding protein [Anaerolineae bacterium]